MPAPSSKKEMIQPPDNIVRLAQARVDTAQIVKSASEQMDKVQKAVQKYLEEAADKRYADAAKSKTAKPAGVGFIIPDSTDPKMEHRVILVEGQASYSMDEDLLHAELVKKHGQALGDQLFGSLFKERKVVSTVREFDMDAFQKMQDAKTVTPAQIKRASTFVPARRSVRFSTHPVGVRIEEGDDA